MANDLIKICNADLMDGLYIDIIEFSDIKKLTEEQKNKLWSKETDLSLIRRCFECELVQTGSRDVPGYSTEFYNLVTYDVDAFKKELREQIWEVINE